MTTVGAMIGGGAMGTKGMLIGGVVGYVWGRFRWSADG